MMHGNGSSIASPTDGIYDPVQSHQPDPNVMQLWTDKPRFGGETQQHHDPWRQQQQPPQKPRIYVPPPPSGATTEEYARWQALQSVMAALQHSSGVLVAAAVCWACGWSGLLGRQKGVALSIEPKTARIVACKH